MNFQYFFFDTYFGYFLQMVPLAAAAGVGVGVWKYRCGAGRRRSVFSGLLAAYLTGLVGLTLLLRIIGHLWYWLFYHQSGGRLWFFEWNYRFIPNFWYCFRRENLANALLFLPFGILHPLAAKKPSLAGTMRTGVLLILGIELLQPIFGRAFDVNDIILNLGGVLLSAGGYFIARWYIHK